MKGTPNKPNAPNAAMMPLFQGGHHWRGIGDLVRSASRIPS